MNTMKTKILLQTAALFLSVLLLFSATGYGSSLTAAAAESPVPAPAPTETAVPSDADRALFAELIEANSFTEMIKRHSSMQIEAAHYDGDDEEVQSFTHFVSAEQFSEEASNGHGQIVMDLFYLWSLTDEEGPYLLEVFLDSEEAYQELLAGRQEDSSLSVDPEEVLIEAMELNGCRYMTTEVSDADWVRARIESDAAGMGIDPVYAYEDGMRFAYSYAFDAETKDLLEIWTVLRESDGTEHSYSLDRFTYDLDYDIAESMFAPYFDAAEFSVINLVFAPGTPEESTMMYMLPKSGVYWTVEYQGEEYTGDVYNDPDCTQVYESGTRSDEITLYIPAQS